MTLCRIRCSIGESPILRPSRASRPTSAPGREPSMVHRSHRNGSLARESIRTSARHRRLSCSRPGRPVRADGPLRNRHDPPNRMPWVAKTCSEVQRSAISAGAAGPDASPPLGGNAHFRSLFERLAVRAPLAITFPETSRCDATAICPEGAGQTNLGQRPGKGANFPSSIEPCKAGTARPDSVAKASFSAGLCRPRRGQEPLRPNSAAVVSSEKSAKNAKDHEKVMG